MLKGNFLYWLTTAPGFSFQGDAWGFSPADADDKTQCMTEGTVNTSGAKREYGQLLHLHTRLLSQLREIRDHLIAPGTLEILAAIRRRTGADPDAALSEITTAVEQAIRALKLSEGQIRDEVMEDYEQAEVDGIGNLPATLARFLAERMEMPGFTYKVIHDENGGWIILWKEYTQTGSVRGSGQFYERPYAWIDE